MSSERDIPLLRPIEDQVDQSTITEAVKKILGAIGEDANRLYSERKSGGIIQDGPRV